MNICVFCGSYPGNKSIYRDTAQEFGRLLAVNNHTLVYGGGNVGLMGIVADAVLAHGGEVTGVIPEFLLKREVGHQSLTKLEVVQTMHERKQRMADLSNAFVAIPGGWGTLDELAEILTWRQLGIITQPIGILNVGEFFTPLITQMERMVEDGFLHQDSLKKVLIGESAAGLLDLIIPHSGL